jgi:hypothetical protein
MALVTWSPKAKQGKNPQLRAIVCVEEVLSVDLDVGYIIVACRRNPAGKSGRSAKYALPHSVLDNECALW